MNQRTRQEARPSQISKALERESVENRSNSVVTGGQTNRRPVCKASGRRTEDGSPLSPRLLDLHATARYLGVSEWTVRTLEHQGLLRRVRVPLAGWGELRKLLFDRLELDALIDAWKASS